MIVLGGCSERDSASRGGKHSQSPTQSQSHALILTLQQAPHAQAVAAEVSVESGAIVMVFVLALDARIVT